MAMEYFCCYNDYFTKTRNLSDGELGRLFRALMTYSATGEKTQLNGREEMAFDFISIDIDTAKERYSAKCEQNRANKRQRPITDDNDRQRPITDVPQEKRKKKNNNPLTPLQGEEGVQSSSRFVPPTPEEVNAYCQERNNGIDGSEFVDFYTSKGWKVGKNPMKDWKAAIRTWERSRKQSVPQPKTESGWY